MLVLDLLISADASGLGIRGYLVDREYYHVRTPCAWKNMNIAYMKLFAVITALLVWRDKLAGLRVVMYCDNESVVNILTYGQSRDMFLQAGMREVVYLQFIHEFELKVVHLTSEQNRVSDWLLRWGNWEARLAFLTFAGNCLNFHIPVIGKLLYLQYLCIN